MKTVKAAIYYCLLILFFRHYLLIKYQKHMISFNHDSNPMMYNCHPNFTNEKLRPWGWSMLPTSPQAYAGPPEPQPPLTCLSPEPVLWTIQETKEETMAPLPASTVSMSELLGFPCLFASFCLFTKTSPKWQESSCRLTYHFLSPNHVWVMVVTLLVYTITCKSWKQPYSVRVSLSYMREKEPAKNTCPQVWLFWSHKCCTWQSQRWDPGLLLVSLSCFMIESGMKLRWMVQHRAGPPLLLALAGPQPIHTSKEMGLISRLCEESCCWPTHPQAMVGVGT